jgi:cobalt/nickel transport protein
MGLDRNTRMFILAALLLSLFLAIFISPFASSFPDGLERVAEEKGFLEKGEEWSAWKLSPLPDYAMPGLGGGALATGAAGFVGTLAVFAIGYAIALLIKPKSKT